MVRNRQTRRVRAAPSLYDLPAVEVGVSISILDDFIAASGMQFKDIYEDVFRVQILKRHKARVQLHVSASASLLILSVASI
jgi:hypothetical protein